MTPPHSRRGNFRSVTQFQHRHIKRSSALPAPPPETVAQRGEDGIPYVSLKTLLELKLASGMTAEHRMQDLADVMQLIRVNALPAEFAEQLNPYVGEAFAKLWRAAQVSDDY